VEHIIGKLIKDFEEGKTTRRHLIGTLVGIAAASATTPGLLADNVEPLKATAINHVSYQVADYTKTRDFYAGLFGMKISADDGKQCNLSLGEINLVVRNGTGTTPLVDHIAYTIENWNKDAVLGELTRRNLNPKSEGPNSFQIRDPDGYHVQLSPKR